jgi:hypothetical protein
VIEEILSKEIPVIVLEEIAGSLLSAEMLLVIYENGKDVEVILQNGFSYTIAADSIEPDEVRDFDLDVAVSVNSRVIQMNGAKLPGNSIVIAPNFVGEFGFELVLTVTAQQLQDAGLDGDKVKLFYVDYNGKVTEQSGLVRNADGSVGVTLTHSSFYVFAEEVPIDAGDDRYRLGDVNGDGRVTIADALEILKFLAKLDSNVTDNSFSLRSSLISEPFRSSPTITDALEVLRYLAKLNSLII